MTDRIDPYYISQLEQVAKMIGWDRIIQFAQQESELEKAVCHSVIIQPDTQGAPLFDLKGEIEKRERKGFHLTTSVSSYLNGKPPTMIVRSKIIRGEKAIKLAEEKGLVLRLFEEDEGNSKEISVAAAKSLRDDYQGPEYTLEKALKRIYVVEQTTKNFNKENE